MGATETTVGVGGAIGLALDEVLALEVELDLVVGVEGEHLVLDLTGLAMTDAGGSHGLEPMAEGIGATVSGPVYPKMTTKQPIDEDLFICQLVVAIGSADFPIVCCFGGEMTYRGMDRESQGR